MNFHTDTDVRECDDVREELQPYLLTQYADSVTITQLLADFRDNIDAQNDTDLIEKQFMDIDKVAYDQYTVDRDTIFLIWTTMPCRFKQSIHCSLFGLRRIPQSYCYV